MMVMPWRCRRSAKRFAYSSSFGDFVTSIVVTF